jgi:hypothetical protein
VKRTHEHLPPSVFDYSAMGSVAGSSGLPQRREEPGRLVWRRPCRRWSRSIVNLLSDMTVSQSYRVLDGSRSRAVQRLASTGFRVRLFSSLGLVVAPPACEPGKDTSVTSFPRLHHLAPGQPLLLTARSPGATGLASSLSGRDYNFPSNFQGAIITHRMPKKSKHWLCPVQA